jgi:hypothetical protein
VGRLQVITVEYTRNVRCVRRKYKRTSDIQNVPNLSLTIFARNHKGSAVLLAITYNGISSRLSTGKFSLGIGEGGFNSTVGPKNFRYNQEMSLRRVPGT